MSPYTFAQLTYILQFTHLEKLHADLPGITEEAVASLYEVNLATYRKIKSDHAGLVRQAALELLGDAVFAGKLDRLPFTPGSVIAAVGDSITDDSQSWAEILRCLLDLRRPQDKIRLVNTAISGDTTNHLICRFLEVVKAQPDWIVCMIGTNDARLHGMQPLKPLVSPDETARNLEMLRNFAATQARARWAWITPPAVIEAKIPAHWHLGPMQISWSNRDLAAVADIVRGQPGIVIDLQPVFGEPVNPRYLLEDGLHPSLMGQKAIVRALVDGWITC